MAFKRKVEKTEPVEQRQLDFDKDIAKFTVRQMEACAAVDAGCYKFILYGGALGGGKLIDIAELIPTVTGWKTMGDMAVGDKVFNEDGKVCNVVAVSGIQYDKTFLMKFSDGSQIIAGASHEWITETDIDREKMLRRTDEFRLKRRLKRLSRGKGKRPDLAKRNSERKYDYFPSIVPTVKTTQQIHDTLMVGVQVNHSIPVCQPLELPDVLLPISPYVLGAWLGDGCSTAGQITGIDEDIFNEIRISGYNVTDHACIKSKGILKLKSQLREFNLYGNKHIPLLYLRSSFKQRLSLLQGLMDTDGTCDKRGQCEIQLTHKKLIEGVYELICSLGIKVQMREGRSILNGKDYGVKYRLKFMTNLPVFRLKRKLERQKREGFRGTHNRRYITSVEEIPQIPMKCIQVDSPSHMYLVGKSMIPTHNSYFLRWVLVRLLVSWFFEKGLSKVKVMLACEDYPQLKDRQLDKIEVEFPSWLGKSYQDHKVYGRCFILSEEYGGGAICFRNLDDASKYQSSEWAAAAIDELTKNDYNTFTEVRKRLRWPGLTDDECVLIGGTNPGGIGHGYCKAFWIDKIYPPEFKGKAQDAQGNIVEYDYTEKFCYVPAKADDNPYLDAGYWMMLNTLPQHQRAAFRDGSWDTFVGQAFQEWSRAHHVVKNRPVPANAPLFMTFDWGFGAPFSIGWWWLDSDGRFYRFAEWYGWNGTPNKGLRLSDSEVAKGIIKREEAMGFTVKENKDGKVVVNPQITRLCDPTCFNKKPDWKGGGQGPSTADEFRGEGIILRPGDPNRKLKWRQFHERLHVPVDDDGMVNGVPMMQIYENCVHFIRTIPDLVVNPNNIEDIDTDAEDHVADEAALLCMARPLAISKFRDSLKGKKEEKKRPPDISTVAYLELQECWKQNEMYFDSTGGW